MLWQRFLVTPSVHFDCRLLLPEDKELNGSVPMTRPAQSLSLMAPIHTSYLHVPDPIDMLPLSAAALAAVLPRPRCNIAVIFPQWNRSQRMPIGTRTTFEGERTTGAVARDAFAIGVAMRFAIIGACLSAIGGIALIAGGIAPVSALMLAVCGGAVAFVSLRFLTRWDTAQPPTRNEAVRLTSTNAMHRRAYFIE